MKDRRRKGRERERVVWPLVSDLRETTKEKADVASMEESLNMADITKFHRLQGIVGNVGLQRWVSGSEYVPFSKKHSLNPNPMKGGDSPPSLTLAPGDLVSLASISIYGHVHITVRVYMHIIIF